MNQNAAGGLYHGAGGSGSGAGRYRASDAGRGHRGGGDEMDAAGNGGSFDGAGGGRGGPAGGGGDDNGSGRGGSNGRDSDQMMVATNEVDELYVDPDDADSVANLVTGLREMLDYVRRKPLLVGGSASFMRDYLRTLLASNSSAADVAASVRDARVTRVRSALASAVCAGDYQHGLSPPPPPPRSPGSDQDVPMEVLGNGDGSGAYGVPASGHPFPPGFGPPIAASGSAGFPAAPAGDGVPGTAGMDHYMAGAEPVDASPGHSDGALVVSRPMPSVGDAGSLFANLSDGLAQQVFSYLDGAELAQMHGVCQRWRELASDPDLWKALTLRHWRALEFDMHVWKFIDPTVEAGDPQKWRRIYPAVSTRARWTCRLQKTGKFICNLVAHHIAGAVLGDDGLPSVLVVERRFNIHHLKNFVMPNASVLYFEPETESDSLGFHDFIDYLTKRTRAGLALEEHPPQRRFIFIPPCEYSRELGYYGQSLLGVVQVAYPPINQ